MSCFWTRIAHSGHSRASWRVWECEPGEGEDQETVAAALVGIIPVRNRLSDASQSPADSRGSQSAAETVSLVWLEG